MWTAVLEPTTLVDWLINYNRRRGCSRCDSSSTPSGQWHVALRLYRLPMLRICCPEQIVECLRVTVDPPTARQTFNTIRILSRHVNDWANRTGCTVHQTNSARDDPTCPSTHQRLVVRRIDPATMLRLNFKQHLFDCSSIKSDIIADLD